MIMDSAKNGLGGIFHLRKSADLRLKAFFHHRDIDLGMFILVKVSS